MVQWIIITYVQLSLPHATRFTSGSLRFDPHPIFALFALTLPAQQLSYLTETIFWPVFNLHTFGCHVTVSEDIRSWYDGVEPVFATDSLSSFIRFYFFARLGRQLRDGAERNCEDEAV